MRIFADECFNFDLMTHFAGYNLIHISDTTLRGMKNGALLRTVAADYDVFLTTDRHIPNQQNLKKFDLVFVIMRGVTNDLDDLLPLVPRTRAALDEIARGETAPGDCYEIFT